MVLAQMTADDDPAGAQDSPRRVVALGPDDEVQNDEEQMLRALAP